jgi:hypothetical protein
MYFMPPKKHTRPKKVLVNNPPSVSLKKEVVVNSFWRDGLLNLLFLFLLIFPFIPPVMPNSNNLPYYGVAFFFLILILGTSLLLLGTFYGQLRGWVQVPRSKFFWLPIFYLLARILSGLVAPIKINAFWGDYGGFADGIAYLLVIYGLGYVVMSLKLNKKELANLLKALIWQFAILSGAAILEGLMGGFPFQIVRVDTLFYNSDFYISYALLFIPLAAWQAWRVWQIRKEKVNWRMKYGGWILLVVGLLGLFLAMPTDIQKQVIFWAPVSQTTTSKNVVINFLNNNSNTERFTQWKLGLKMGLSSPILGVGAGMIRENFYHYVQQLPDWNYGVAMSNPHNDLIEQFAEYGLVGLLTYLVMWFALFKMGWRKNRESRLLLGGMLLYLVFNLFLFTSLTSGLYLWMMVFLVLQFAELVTWKNLAELKFKKQFLGVILIVLSLGVLILDYGFIRYFSAELRINQSMANEAAKNYSQAAIDAQRAVQIFPDQAFYAYYASNTVILPFITHSTNDSVKIRAKSLSLAIQASQTNPSIALYSFNVGLLNYFWATTSQQNNQAILEVRQSMQKDPWDFLEYQRIREMALTKYEIQRLSLAQTQSDFARMIAGIPSNKNLTAQITLFKQSLPK